MSPDAVFWLAVVGLVATCVAAAIATGIMALGMMIPAMSSGWIQEQLGYPGFFLWILVSTIPGFIVAAMIRIDPEFGRKK